ncbi:R3H-associated N-terminal domain-domain-containing protein [Microdochium bolleyi]|uniref:R3H-associated N-terminal domain-domain-containing protein n=1 Tax=Microdochium bolleyi TaxID=196109 RepID=A0A136JEU4_9PEZI|nr:R3H-associated N-terminal domain-domain-containing protein [Microdochium bolleyi]
MAIFSAVPPPPGLRGASLQDTTTSTTATNHADNLDADPTTSSTIDIEAWAVSAIESLRVSPVAAAAMTTVPRPKQQPLSIPLDEDLAKTRKVSIDPRAKNNAVTPPPRPASRRDSMKRRDSLIIGKEGSRQRRRWENDRLLHVPNVQPPEPIDWEHRPTHPVVHVPYQLASAWDLHVRARVESKTAAAARRKQTQTRTLGDEHVTGRVPRELFVRAKKVPAVKTWVRSLEEPVRKFLVDREVAKPAAPAHDESESSSTEDEEIVFVGRNGTMRDGWKKAKRETKGPDAATQEGMIFDALGDDDESSAFKRWITHSISDYYGLTSQSVLVGNPKRKVVYVSVKTSALQKNHQLAPDVAELPRPLWELC